MSPAESSVTRFLGVVVLGALALAGCGGQDPPGDRPAMPKAAPSSAALPATSPTPTGPVSPDPAGERTVESLGAQLEFASPDVTDPDVAEAVAAYERVIRNFVIAEGLPDRDYAPLIAGIDPAFVERALANARQNIESGYFTLGPFTETVREAAGSRSTVYLTSCRDYRERTYYLQADGSEISDQELGVVPVLVTMIKPADTWLIAESGRSDVLCS